MSLNYTRVPAVSYPPLKRPSVFSIAGDTLPTFTQAESSQPDHNGKNMLQEHSLRLN